MTKPILFFDGVCGLCNRSVNLLMKWDKNDQLQFAPLQGETAKKLLPQKVIEDFDSMVLFENGNLHFKSNGILKGLSIIGRGYQVFGIFYIIPTFLRNLIYDGVAKVRYQLFGKSSTCRMPTEKEKGKLLP